MSDAEPGRTAGALLREARLARGLSVENLASSIKVTPRKIELLESDRGDELHDAAFARALAHTLCRSLKIDPAPVLERMPQAPGHHLEQMHQGLNEPFRDKPVRLVPKDLAVLTRPAIWAPALVLLAAGALYLWPPGSGVVQPAKTVVRQAPSTVTSSVIGPNASTATAPAAGASASVPTVPPPPAVETVFAAPVEDAGSAPQTSAVNGMLQLRTTSQSWVEVIDARGQMLLSRTIQPGETVGLDGPLPLKIKIGNAAGTQMVFRGEAVDLNAHTRENIARLELK
jgi:cytoskeleton protein RodZ